MTIEKWLKAENSPAVGQALMAWAGAVPGRVLAGELMIGILASAELKLVPEALKKADECGVEEALVTLGNWYLNPMMGQWNLPAAEEVFRQAVAGRRNGAQLRLAELIWFYRREGASKELQDEAFALARGLADAGNAQGLYLMGLMTNDGFGNKADPQEAFKLLKKAGEMGDADALLELYLYCEMGNGTKQDSEAAVRFLKAAAEKEQPRAMYNMGACLMTGRGMPRDPVAAAQWYGRASDAGHIGATVNLARMYAAGEGVKKDLERANALLDEAEYMGADIDALWEEINLAKDA
jgi:TPR repeat protein